MSVSQWRTAALLLALCSCCLVLRSAHAQTADAASLDGARAVEKGREAVALYEQGDWRAALQVFREAEALYHTPVFVLYEARCLRQLGQLLEAKAHLVRVTRESLDAAAPPPWRKAQDEAQAELQQLTAEIPTVTVTIEGQAPERPAQLTLDERAVQPGQALEVDPGPHRMRAVDGSRTQELSFDVARGQNQQLTLTLPPLARPTTPATRAPHPLRHPPAARVKARGPYWPGWVLTGSGTAALAAGGIVGVLALKEASAQRDTLPASCQKQRCLESDRTNIESRFDSADNLALVSDILWISGAVLATTGVALIVVEPRSKTASLSMRGRF